MTMSERERLLRDQHEWMKGRRYPHETAIQQISDLVMPFRGDINTSRGMGGNRVSGVFDSTGVMAADRFVQFVMGVVLPKTIPWLRLQHADCDQYRPGLKKRVQQPLDRVSMRTLGWLSQSNFYLESQSFVRDFSVIGTGCLQVEKRMDKKRKGFGYVFKAIPFGDIWFATGKDGRPFHIVRRLEMPAIEARRVFESPGKRAMVSQAMDPVCYLHHVFENDDETKGWKTKKPWASVWVEEETGTVVRQGGFDWCPYIVSRWEVVAGEEYGRGRGHIARPNLLGVNEACRRRLNALTYSLEPRIMVAHDGVFNLKGGPGTELTLRHDSKDQILPQFMQTGADFQAAQIIIEEDKRQIKEAFLADHLAEPESQTRSAEAELSRRNRAIQALSGSMNPIESDFFDPLVDALIGIAHEAGELPELAEVAAITGETEIDLRAQYLSPFFTAQRSAIGQRARQAILELAEIAQISGRPEIMDWGNLDATAEAIIQYGDAPAAIMRSPEEVEQIRAGRQALEDQQIQLQNLETGSKAAANLAKAQSAA